MQHLLPLLAASIVIALGLSLLVVQAITGVPSMSATSAETADVVALLRQANLKDGAIIYDLGCGWGALVIALAAAFPQARIRGVELSPFPYWIARLRTRGMPNVTLQRRNFHNCDVRDADALTCYLMTKAMPRLSGLLDNSLKPGTPVVALTFWFRNRQVAATREGPGLRGAAALYYWPATKQAAS